MANTYNHLVYKGLKANLPVTRNVNSFYLCTDTKEIYFGYDLYSGKPVQFFESADLTVQRDFPANPTPNVLYIDEADMSGWVYNPDKTGGAGWEQVIASQGELTYQIREVATSSGAFKTYALFCNNEQVPTDDPTKNVVIDIPKDFLVKSAVLSTVTQADKDPGGKFENDPNFEVGDKYIDFTVNSRTLIPAVGEFQDYPAGTAFYADQFGVTLVDTSAFLPTTDVSAYFVVNGATESHIYLNVKDLVDVYTAGWGLGLGDGVATYDDGSTVIPEGAFYARLNPAKKNGLEVTADGIGLNLATATHDEYEAATGTAQAGVTYYSDNQGTVADPQPAVGSDVTGYYVAVEVAATAGAMSGPDKDKLEEAYYAITIGTF